VGYWSGHIPFACDLIHTLRPDVFVELGTHTGESYFAFCQAIQESGAKTRAFAVDTWRGDQHTGAYSDEVFAEVSAENAMYKSFSELVRSTFDEAAAGFANESIDLLHIDGAHVYEHVRHDFELWWAKVRKGGIVLLHDSFERSHGFGVWRLLSELATRYPATEFTHSHGLGIVCKPPVSKSHIAGILVGTDERERNAIRRYYETVAARQKQSFFAEHRRSSDWEVTSQLFWSYRGAPFTEPESVRAAEVVGARATRIRFPVPNRGEAPERLRLAVSLTPAMLALHAVALRDAAGESIWREEAAASIEKWRAGGLRGILRGQKALLVDVPERAGLDLDIPAELVALLSGGGTLEMELTGVDPFEMLSLAAPE
jgi:hypothetical protein